MSRVITDFFGGGDVMSGKARLRKVGRRPAEEAEETRRRIVDAALALFAERGYEGVSVRDIAEGAGAAHGLIRHHFGSKEGVWRAVVDAAGAEYEGALRSLMAGAVSEEEAVVAAAEVVRGVVLVSARHPGIASLLAHEGTGGGERLDHLIEHAAPLRELWAPIFARAQNQGYLRQFDEDTFFLFLLTAGVIPFALSALSGGILGADMLAEEQAEQHADCLVQTLFGDIRGDAR
jgi:AcrR family transcriptional regulator